MKPPEEIKREFVRQWMHKAEADLATAHHLSVTRIDLGFAIGFHAQQAVEKIAKAVLVWHQVEFFKTHDLTRLAQLLAQVDPRLAEVIRAADELTSYAVEARYPGDLPEPSAAEARHALALAEAVRAAANHSLPRELN